MNEPHTLDAVRKAAETKRAAQQVYREITDVEGWPADWTEFHVATTNPLLVAAEINARGSEIRALREEIRGVSP